MFRLFEERARHRMTLERLREEGAHQRSMLGLGAGFATSLAVLGGAVYCATISQPTVAMVLGGLDIVALAGVFIYGAQTRRAERRDQLALLRDIRRESSVEEELDIAPPEVPPT
jgi:hypothetical protein